MNNERILKVADMIEAHPEHFHMKFFMDIQDDGWDGRVGPHETERLLNADLFECGTTACIAGWACWLWAADVNPSLPIDDNAAKILGLDEDTAYELFSAFELSTAEAAASHLRAMV